MNHLVCFVLLFFFSLRARASLVCAERLFMFIYKAAARTKPSDSRFPPSWERGRRGEVFTVNFPFTVAARSVPFALAAAEKTSCGFPLCFSLSLPVKAAVRSSSHILSGPQLQHNSHPFQTWQETKHQISVLAARHSSPCLCARLQTES